MIKHRYPEKALAPVCTLAASALFCITAPALKAELIFKDAFEPALKVTDHQMTSRAQKAELTSFQESGKINSKVSSAWAPIPQRGGAKSVTKRNFAQSINGQTYELSFEIQGELGEAVTSAYLIDENAASGLQDSPLAITVNANKNQILVRTGVAGNPSLTTIYAGAIAERMNFNLMDSNEYSFKVIHGEKLDRLEFYINGEDFTPWLADTAVEFSTESSRKLAFETSGSSSGLEQVSLHKNAATSSSGKAGCWVASWHNGSAGSAGSAWYAHTGHVLQFWCGGQWRNHSWEDQVCVNSMCQQIKDAHMDFIIADLTNFNPHVYDPNHIHFDQLHGPDKIIQWVEQNGSGMKMTCAIDGRVALNDPNNPNNIRMERANINARMVWNNYAQRSGYLDHSNGKPLLIVFVLYNQINLFWSELAAAPAHKKDYLNRFRIEVAPTRIVPGVRSFGWHGVAPNTHGGTSQVRFTTSLSNHHHPSHGYGYAVGTQEYSNRVAYVNQATEYSIFHGYDNPEPGPWGIANTDMTPQHRLQYTNDADPYVYYNIVKNR